MNRPWIGILMALFFVGLVGWSSKKSDGEWPARPVKVVVPFAAGGGSDSFARQLILVIQDKGLFRQPMVVINVEGAGGTIGSRRVRNARPDGYTMLMLHEGILTAHYSGSVSYGPEAFQAVAGTGRMAMVIAVRDDSPIRNLKQAMVDWPIQGRPLNFAVNMGAPSHFAGLILEKSRVGVAFNFVQFGGGANRFAALTGGHADLSIFSVEEFLRYQGGGLRALAVLSPERHPAIPQVKTAREQGFDLVYSSMHFWWMPKGTPAAVCDRMADVIEEAMATTEMKKNLAESSTEPVILRGEALAGELRKRDGEISGVSLRKSAVLPNFPFWMMVATVLLIPFIVWIYLARSPSE